MARSTVEFEKDILDGLHWLGLTWDEGPEVAGEAARGPYAPYRQMERLPSYAAAAERLLAADQAYPCYCTADELAADRSRAGGGQAATEVRRPVRGADVRGARRAWSPTGAAAPFDSGSGPASSPSMTSCADTSSSTSPTSAATSSSSATTATRCTTSRWSWTMPRWRSRTSSAARTTCPTRPSTSCCSGHWATRSRGSPTCH